MAARSQRPRLAVISPFLDKSHGTERRVVEWVSHLADNFETHIYSQHVEDVDFSKVVWHRIPKLPGPHLVNFVWWLAANHLWRSWDRHVRGLRHDLIFSPGINCLDADAVSVHIVFAEYVRRVGTEMNLLQSSIRNWPALLHRRLYYRLLVSLEHRVYTNPRTVLILIARKTAAGLERFYGRVDRFPVLYLGLDHAIFNPVRRQALRDKARRELGLSATRVRPRSRWQRLEEQGCSCPARCAGTSKRPPGSLDDREQGGFGSLPHPHPRTRVGGSGEIRSAAE